MAVPAILDGSLNSPGSMVASRLSIYTLPWLLLALLPLVVSVTSASLLTTLTALSVILLLRVVLNLSALSCRQTPVLEGLALSHFVELARWSLDASAVPYIECDSPGVIFAMVLGRSLPALHIPGTKTSLGDSQAILAYLSFTTQAPFLRPVTSTADKALLTLLDSGMLHFRRVAYYDVLFLPPPQRKRVFLAAWGAHQPSIPLWQRAVLRIALPAALAFLVSRLRLTRAGADRSRKRVEEVLVAVDARLADGRKYLLGDEMSYVDIMLAVQVGLLLRPREFGGGIVADASFLSRKEFSTELQTFAGVVEERPAGRLCLRLYKEERGRMKGRVA